MQGAGGRGWISRAILLGRCLAGALRKGRALVLRNEARAGRARTRRCAGARGHTLRPATDLQCTE